MSKILTTHEKFDLEEMYSTGHTALVLHKSNVAKRLENVNPEHIPMFDTVSWQCSSSSTVASLLRSDGVREINDKIEMPGLYRMGNHLHYVYRAPIGGEYIYDGKVYPKDQEPLLREVMDYNTRNAESFFITGIDDFPELEELSVKFAICRPTVIPEDAELLTDISRIAPYDILYIKHRGVIMACTMITYFKVVSREEFLRTKFEVGMVYVDKATGEVICVVEDYDVRNEPVLMWNDSFFDISDPALLLTAIDS